MKKNPMKKNKDCDMASPCMVSIEFEVPSDSSEMIQALLGLEALRRRFGSLTIERVVEAYTILSEIREIKSASGD